MKSYKGSSLADALEGFLTPYGPSETPWNAPDYLTLPGSQDELDSAGYSEKVGRAWGNMWRNGADWETGLGTVFNRTNPSE